DYLLKISLNTQYIMENMGDIVCSINPANDSIQKVISKMREFATTILEPKHIKFDLQIADDLANTELKMEYRRDLFLIYKEAINNAAKYANCSSVRVKLFKKNKHLILLVQDNGIGFDTAEGKTGNGLSSMGRRASLMGGELLINSKKNEGTSIELVIPLFVVK
ncbi:MAG: histidine kinase, partial [Bacteroidia bacterium]|nr:histidine kinase [Bacteroidia bacterium]